MCVLTHPHCVSERTHTCTRKVLCHVGIPQVQSTLFSDTSSLVKSGAHQLGQTGYPWGSPGPAASASPELGWQACICPASVWAQDMDSGLCARKASALLTEPSPTVKGCF